MIHTPLTQVYPRDLKAVETGYNKAKGNEALKTNVSPSLETAKEYFYSAFSLEELGDYRAAIEDFNKAPAWT